MKSGEAPKSFAYSQPESTSRDSSSFSTWVSDCKGRGTGYDVGCWNKYDYLTCLFMLFFGSTNGQGALGAGFVNGTKKQDNLRISYTNDYGMWGVVGTGSVATMTRMSFLWINDYWGNMYQWMGGLGATSDYSIWYSDVSTTVATSNILASGFTATISGYTTKILGDSHGVSLPIAGKGSATTYECDSGNIFFTNNITLHFGGIWWDNQMAGPFKISNEYGTPPPDLTYSFSGRLQYSKLIGTL